LIAGISTRAAAESAARAGYDVTAIDAFGDRDQHPSVRALSLPRDCGAPFTPTSAAREARGVECDMVVYLSSFENHPAAVSRLAEGRELLGNPPSVLQRVHDPRIVTDTLRSRGQPVPPVRFGPPARGRWLTKPLSSGGGRGVRFWRRGDRLPRRCYLQEFIEGTSASIVFLASGGRAVPIGMSRQLVGDHAFGAAGFKYCGNILASAGHAPFDDPALFRAVCGLARSAAAGFELRGVNGIDFVARRGLPFAVEINPRWSASVELVEIAYGLSVFAAHTAACRGGLPDFDLGAARRSGRTIGKAIVFARRDVTVGDTYPWLSQRDGEMAFASVRDVPQPGDRVPAGRPVCTVFASGKDDAACYAGLVRRADWVYAQLLAWERNVA
jgi:predicted ATP-grasp superfamily ATP-dependent carboligase